MENALQQLASGSRVAVIRLRSLGDCVLTTPALAILKQSRPDLQVAVVVEDRFAAVFEGNPDVQCLLPPTMKALGQWRPDLCINLHGGTRSMLLTLGSAARMRAGFAHFRGPGIYNLRIPTAQQILGVSRTIHTAEHLASAMFYLGATIQPILRAKLFATRRTNRAPFAIVHAVASSAEKTWDPKKFLVVAQHLQSCGLKPVFIAGPGEDLSTFGEFQCIAGAPLSETKSLLATASLFVGNDSGPAHMAAAFGVPVVVLYRSSDPIVWAPWQVECRVLTGRDSNNSIETAQVIEAIDELRVRQ